jgi:hypothetical protein
MNASHTRPGGTVKILGAGVVGLLLCGVGAFLDRAAFFEAWLVSWLFLLGIALASMAQVMIHEVTGGEWGRVLRAPLEAATLSLPLLFVLALPLAFGLPDLFAWARPDDVAKSTWLQARTWYLGQGPFLLRNAGLLFIWCLLGFAMVQSANAGPDAVPRARKIAVLGMLVYLFTVTVAAFDWIASLVPGWSSTTIGIRLGTSQFMGSLAFAILFVLAGARRRGTAVPPARDLQDFGNLFITYAMMWAYIAFTQYLIVWAEDLPRETLWYWPRATTSWRWLVLPVGALEFVLPVVAMLFRPVKRSARAMTVVCALVLAGQWLDTAWLVLPSLRTAGFAVHGLDVCALVGMGGVWLYVVLRLRDRLTADAARFTAVTAHG